MVEASVGGVAGSEKTASPLSDPDSWFSATVSSETAIPPPQYLQYQRVFSGVNSVILTA
jgi:hypothetical protein